MYSSITRTQILKEHTFVPVQKRACLLAPRVATRVRSMSERMLYIHVMLLQLKKTELLSEITDAIKSSDSFAGTSADIITHTLLDCALTMGAEGACVSGAEALGFPHDNTRKIEHCAQTLDAMNRVVTRYTDASANTEAVDH
jgi:hypothetical protein